jgi:hypothetical protein
MAAANADVSPLGAVAETSQVAERADGAEGITVFRAHLGCDQRRGRGASAKSEGPLRFPFSSTATTR